MDEEKKEEVPEEAKEPKAVEKKEPAGGHRYAGFWIRFVAIIIDGIILGVVSRILFPVDAGASIFTDTNSLLRDVLTWAYYTVMTAMYGATVGKMVLGLKVIKEDGQQPDWGTAVIREVIGKTVSAIILGIGFIMAGFDAKKQGLHDKIAKTYVVYK